MIREADDLDRYEPVPLMPVAPPMSYPPLNHQEAQFIHFVEAHSDLGYGRMMQLISGLWRDKDPIGAQLVNETYGGLALKKKRCKREGHDWSNGRTRQWCDRCGASRPKPIRKRRKR